jgi:hypothetical protein
VKALTIPEMQGPWACLSGAYITFLMRINQVSIRELAKRMNITLKRIREVKARGVDGAHMCQDWYEGITQTGLFKNGSSSAKRIAGQPVMTTYTGYVRFEGVRIQVDFEVPSKASHEQKELAFMSALAQKAEINYLEIGES